MFLFYRQRASLDKYWLRRQERAVEKSTTSTSPQITPRSSSRETCPGPRQAGQAQRRLKRQGSDEARSPQSSLDSPKTRHASTSNTNRTNLATANANDRGTKHDLRAPKMTRHARWALSGDPRLGRSEAWNTQKDFWERTDHSFPLKQAC